MPTSSLPLGGPPLGFAPLAPDQDVRVLELGVEEGVLLVTDGLFEGFTEPGSTERLGYDGFIALLREERSRTQDPRFLVTLADRLERMNGGPLSDDAAALLILRRQV